ncbi:sodium-dependent glucose transporter 1A-like [Mizuhopecten yessoensis]|uniref:Sodium-dependent glucose transporter 1 n=1 Tax=Mizuhopecten yessoensis TaxID=6573 RepID=A0A210QG31_MIZYE|nr:sodium-dependent glucose transporter 1A-like [Mizuhopecten yessoensis]OWF47704.1 Sodium-dependent glucose transporter 1 [Mizuhopecten yessoensis]
MADDPKLPNHDEILSLLVKEGENGGVHLPESQNNQRNKEKSEEAAGNLPPTKSLDAEKRDITPSASKGEMENEKEDTPSDEKMSFMEKMKTDDSYKEKVFLSLSICWSFVILGWLVAQFGPSFLDLRIITNTDLKKASSYLTSGSVGYLVGSLISGLLFDRFNKVLLLFLYTFTGVFFSAILPWCYLYELMMTVQFCRGFYGGGLDTGGNALLISTWGQDGRSFLQALHFSFAIGGIVSPLVTAPFLLEERDIRTDNSSLRLNGTIYDTDFNMSQILYNTSISSFTQPGMSTTTPDPASGYKAEDSKLYIAFTISAAMNLSSAIPFLILYLRARRRKRKNSIKKVEDSKRITRELTIEYKVLVLVSVCLFLGVYCAVEDTFNAFLTTFCVKHMGWTKAHGSYATSLYWAVYGFGRFSGIWLIKWIKPDKMICGFTVALGCVFGGLLAFAHYRIDGGIWASAILAGAAMSIIFPTVFSWTEDELLPVSGKVASLFLISASSGTMINPILLGYLMDTLSPLWFTYLLFGETIVLILLFIILLLIARILKAKFGTSCTFKDVEIELKSEDDVETESLVDAVQTVSLNGNKDV